MNTKYVVFDFDGTIADTIKLVKQIIDEITDDNKLKSNINLSEMKSMRPQDLMKEYGLNKRQLTRFVLRARKEMTKLTSQLKLIEGMQQALNEIKATGYHLGILTSNSKENVEAFLKNQEISEMFDFVYSGKNIFGKKKIINKMLRKERISKENIIYVGDETRDVEACKKANVPIIAVSWGFNSKTILKQAQANYIADKPKELLNFITENFN